MTWKLACMAEEPKASRERFVLKTSVPNSMIGQVCMAGTVCSAAFVVWAPDVAKEHGSSQKRETERYSGSTEKNTLFTCMKALLRHLVFTCMYTAHPYTYV